MAKVGGVKEAETEAAIAKWLKYSADRDGGRKARAEKKRSKIYYNIKWLPSVMELKTHGTFIQSLDFIGLVDFI